MLEIITKMENKEKTTTKWIKVSQVVTYNQEVELTDEEIEILESADDIDICQCTSNEINRKAFELIENLIDTSDIFDTEQEFTNFELTDN